MLLTKNYHNSFKFVKVITQNTDNVDDVTITSAVHSDMLIYGEGFLIFSKVESQDDLYQKVQNILKLI